MKALGGVASQPILDKGVDINKGFPYPQPQTLAEYTQLKLTGVYWPKGGVIEVTFEDLKDEKLSEELRKKAEKILKHFKRELVGYGYILVDLLISQPNPIEPDKEYFWRSIKPLWAFKEQERREMARDLRFQRAMMMFGWLPFAGSLCYPLGELEGCYIYLRVRRAEPPAKWDNLHEIEFPEEDNKEGEKSKEKTLNNFFGGVRNGKEDIRFY